jgi:peptidase M28-like protein
MEVSESRYLPLGPVAGLLLLGLLVALVALALLPGRLPGVRSASAPAQEFSAERALRHVAVIARAPHPVGSAEHDRVRDYLLTQLRAMGLDVHLQTGTGRMYEHGMETLGRVDNIVARLHGRDPTGKALMLSAHYDSTYLSPGAADNGASVAAVLESLRALRAGPPLRNDLIVLFTDGEEVGLLGAELFARDPWKADVGMVLNFDFRGSSGPMWMFETSRGNARLVAALASGASDPMGSSALFDIYQLLPNDTDMTAFKAAGLSGLNFAAIDHAYTYHSPLDTLDRLDPRTVQQLGELMLTASRSFGADYLAGLGAQDSVFFNLPGLGMLHYRDTWVGPFSVLALCAVALALGLAVRRGETRLRSIVGAATGQFATLLMLTIASQVLWQVVLLVHPQYVLFNDLYNSRWYLLAVVGLVVAGYGWMQAGWRRRLGACAEQLGALLFGACCLVLSTWFLPGFSYLFAWPLLLLAIAEIAIGQCPPLQRRAHARTALLLLASLPTLFFFAPMIRMVYLGLGPQLPLATTFVLGLGLALLSPLLLLLSRRYIVPVLPLAIGVLWLGVGSLTATFDAQHPVPSNLFLAFDGSSGRMLWLSRADELDEWTKPLFPANAAPVAEPNVFGPDSAPLWAGPAAPAPGLLPPSIQVLSDRREGNRRRLALRVRSQREAASLTVRVDGTPVLGSSVDGRRLPNDPDGLWKLETHGLRNDWLSVDLQVASGSPFQLRVYDETYRLPEHFLPPRPPYLIADSGRPSSDTVRTVQIRKFNR